MEIKLKHESGRKPRAPHLGPGSCGLGAATGGPAGLGHGAGSCGLDGADAN